ncbi:hypothetical protein O9H85_02230 [Paenibacillus filicis]|uniref:Uncharacterized protein n=1 Tax=Paenibacillus gyeongsangnamensis TaxID=3388067 RepID=A0ABT4Q372_9BACL|nr:hypothetical protein [Paenibacillus filicis]MCZ8511277.1 hypothetical protein [Paenibacillus filicis]
MEQLCLRSSFMHHEEPEGLAPTVSIGLCEHRPGDDLERLLHSAEVSAESGQTQREKPHLHGAGGLERKAAAPLQTKTCMLCL